MEIETKFKLGQEVWVIIDEEIKKRQIVSISLTKDKYFDHLASSVMSYCRFYIKYGINRELSEDVTPTQIKNKREDQLFATKEELIKSL